MRVGMLWFDDTPDRPLNAKIEQAAQYYKEKYGKSPNVCYVHPSYLPRGDSLDQPIRTLVAHDILPHHLWIGLKTEKQSGS